MPQGSYRILLAVKNYQTDCGMAQARQVMLITAAYPALLRVCLLNLLLESLVMLANSCSDQLQPDALNSLLAE
jgi:hypothetical protein